MNSNYQFNILMLFLLIVANACNISNKENQNEFDKISQLPDWQLKFSDPCTDNWQSNWFLDGEIARVEQGEKGMNLIAGPVNRNDAHHSVLWTKKSFDGDIKIEYDYTRTDSSVVNVNILFIQATGVGTGIFNETKRYSWDLSDFEPITEGRMGLRHMYTRSSSYKDFNVWIK